MSLLKEKQIRFSSIVRNIIQLPRNTSIEVNEFEKNLLACVRLETHDYNTCYICKSQEIHYLRGIEEGKGLIKEVIQKLEK